MSLELPPDVNQPTGQEVFARYIDTFGTSEEQLHALNLVALSSAEATAAYMLALGRIINLVDNRQRIVGEGKATTPDYLQSVKAVGLASNILAQTIDAQHYADHQPKGRKTQIPPKTDELYMEARKRHGKHLIVATGLFDFFGRLYRREVARRYEIGPE